VEPDYLVLLRWDLTNFLPGLSSNLYPFDHCLLNRWDYRCVPMCPDFLEFLLLFFFNSFVWGGEMEMRFEIRALHLLGMCAIT
jgi:hypothetical protein